MKSNLLSNIYNPTDLRLLTEAQLPQIAQELRQFIIDIVSVGPDRDQTIINVE